MTWMAPTVGSIGLLLGGLWMVQGIGWLSLDPAFCVARCEAIAGPDAAWTLIGLLAAAAGAKAVLRGILRRRA